MKRVAPSRKSSAEMVRYAVDTGTMPPQPRRNSGRPIGRFAVALAVVGLATVGFLSTQASRGPAALASSSPDCASARDEWRPECRSLTLSARQDPRPALVRAETAKRTSTAKSLPRTRNVDPERSAPPVEPPAEEPASAPDDAPGPSTEVEPAVASALSLGAAAVDRISSLPRAADSLEAASAPEAAPPKLQRKAEAVRPPVDDEDDDEDDAEEPVRKVRPIAAPRLANLRARAQARPAEVAAKPVEKARRRAIVCDAGERLEGNDCVAIAKSKAKPVVAAKRMPEPVVAAKRMPEPVVAAKRAPEPVVAATKPAPRLVKAPSSEPALHVRSQAAPAVAANRKVTAVAGRRKVSVCLYFVVCL
jgi:hypothetical protein